MRVLQFDFDGGRLDVSSHPFSGGVPEDVRLTTRFRDDEFVQSLMGTIHETGHGRYEQNLPRELLGQPVAEARSMAIHESQSLSFEMQVGCHPGFVGAHRAADPRRLRRPARAEPPTTCSACSRACSRASSASTPTRSPTRRTSSCATRSSAASSKAAYEVDDIPALWDEHMMKLLGVDTRGNYRDGPMQDVHWPEGLFGYFAVLLAGRDVRVAVVRHHAPPDARPRRPDLRRQPRRRCSTGCATTSGRRPAAGPPTSCRCARRARR